jgi:IMP and pyridine-specific 5'-nucleotidase
MRLEGPDCRLKFLEIQPDHLYAFEEKDIKEFLDLAEHSLSECADRMQLAAKIIRKDRAVGLIPSVNSMPSLVNDPLNATKPLMVQYRIEREQLDECVLSTQRYLMEHYTKSTASSADAAVPAYCVFNGGRDVWVDIGNKLIGVQYLQRLLQSDPAHTLHVGDQFLSTGNDIATRSACATIWIISPLETEQILSQLIADRLQK